MIAIPTQSNTDVVSRQWGRTPRWLTVTLERWRLRSLEGFQIVSEDATNSRGRMSPYPISLLPPTTGTWALAPTS